MASARSSAGHSASSPLMMSQLFSALRLSPIQETSQPSFDIALLQTLYKSQHDAEKATPPSPRLKLYSKLETLLSCIFQTGPNPTLTTTRRHHRSQVSISLLAYRCMCTAPRSLLFPSLSSFPPLFLPTVFCKSCLVDIADHSFRIMFLSTRITFK